MLVTKTEMDNSYVDEVPLLQQDPLAENQNTSSNAQI